MKSLFKSFAYTSGLLIYFPPYWFLGKPHMHALRTPEKTEGVAYAPVLRSFCQGVQALLPGWGAESDTADDSQLTMSSGVSPRGRKSLHLRLSLTGGESCNAFFMSGPFTIIQIHLKGHPFSCAARQFREDLSGTFMVDLLLPPCPCPAPCPIHTSPPACIPLP